MTTYKQCNKCKLFTRADELRIPFEGMSPPGICVDCMVRLIRELQDKIVAFKPLMDAADRVYRVALIANGQDVRVEEKWVRETLGSVISDARQKGLIE